MAYNLGKAQTERACAISWFANWPQDKRVIFLERLREKQSLDLATESLLADLDRMSIQQGKKGTSDSLIGILTLDLANLQYFLHPPCLILIILFSAIHTFFPRYYKLHR